MLPAAARLPDALVRLPPVLDHEVNDAREVLPVFLVHLAAEPAVNVRRVQDLPVDVELELGVGAVANADRAGTAVTFQLCNVELGQAALAADAVHQL